jgi:hypothetical protein
MTQRTRSPPCLVFLPSSDFLGQLNLSFLVQRRWNGAAPEDGRSLSASARNGPHRRARAHWPTVCPRTPWPSEAGPGEFSLVLNFSHWIVLELPGSPPPPQKKTQTHDTIGVRGRSRYSDILLSSPSWIFPPAAFRTSPLSACSQSRTVKGACALFRPHVDSIRALER